MTRMYWEIGQIIACDVFDHQRAEYGKVVVSNLVTQFTAHLGRGWSQQHLIHCLRISETFPDEQIV